MYVLASVASCVPITCYLINFDAGCVLLDARRGALDAVRAGPRFHSPAGIPRKMLPGGLQGTSMATSALHKQVAVVTGGGRGIGASIARTLAEMGAQVVICGRNAATLDKTAEQIRGDGAQCEAMVCDVRELKSVESLAAGVEQKFGRVDILVNNAGLGAFSSPLHQLPPDEWDAVLSTNLRGVYYCVRAFVPMMIRAQSGHIINISSIASKNPLPKGAA